MRRMIATCGLDCETCDAYIATVNNDDEMRAKVARLWSDLNSVEILPEMIHCEGCRMEGVKTPYCESLCPIRQCAMAKHHETCGSCRELETCDKIAKIIRTNPNALRNLKLES